MSGSRAAPLLLAGAAAGALLGWGGTRLFGGGERDALLETLTARQDERLEAVTSLAEENARAVHETALQQFYLLQRFRQAGVDGGEVVWVVRGDGTDLSAAGASSLPLLAVDPRARTAWAESVARLETFVDQVDPGVADAFRTVRSLADAHPWPAGSGPAAVAGTDWARPDVIESWLTANRALVSRVDAVLSGF